MADDTIHQAASLAGRPVIPLDDLEHTRHAHEVEGAALDPDVPFSVILVHSGPGVGPKVHRHPYPEVFVVESGEATFRLGDDEVVVTGGHVVVSPSGVAHGFTNTGDRRAPADRHPRRRPLRHRVARGRRPRVDHEAAPAALDRGVGPASWRRWRRRSRPGPRAGRRAC